MLKVVQNSLMEEDNRKKPSLSQSDISAIQIYTHRIIVLFSYGSQDFKINIMIKERDGEVCLEVKNPTKKFLAIPEEDREELMGIILDEYVHTS